MANWNRWGIAAGLAGALAIFGTAQAQGVGSGSAPQTASPSSGSTSGSSTGSTADRNTDTTTNDPSVRSGWSGHPQTEQGQASEAKGSSGSSAGSAGSSASATGGKVDKKLQEDIQKIHAANQAEVHMGQMAQQQASSEEVKQFGQKLEQDHQALDDKLTQAAQSAGISLEGKGTQAEQKDAQKMMDKLQGKTGQDFDKAFVSMMVKDHEKDIKETKKAASEAKKQHQTELASILDQGVTGMQSHLATAKELEKTVGKGKSASGSSRSSTGSSGSSGTGSSGMSGSSGSSGSAAGSSGSSEMSGNAASGSAGSKSENPVPNTSKSDQTTKTKKSPAGP